MSDDDFTSVRLLRRDQDLPSEVVDASLDRARLRFEAATRATAGPTGGAVRARPVPPVRFLPRSRPALLAGAAVVVAGGLVASGIGFTHWTAPESAAAATLHEAASAAAADRAPTGPYTKVVASELSMVSASADGEHYDEGYLEPTTTTTWVPADVAGTWVRETQTGAPTRFFGGAAARKAAADDQASRAGGGGPVEERGVGGDFAVGELGGDQPGVLGAADIAGLPRDPGALVRRIEASPRPVDTSDTVHAFDTIGQLLRTGLVPADLRATMYDALASLPGIVVTEEQASLDGRTGTAVGLRNAAGSERHDVIIDRTTGTYVGERTVQTRRTGSVPAGTVIDSVAVRATAVSDQP